MHQVFPEGIKIQDTSIVFCFQNDFVRAIVSA